jgi:6-phosphogluconolactonase
MGGERQPRAGGVYRSGFECRFLVALLLWHSLACTATERVEPDRAGSGGEMASVGGMGEVSGSGGAQDIRDGGTSAGRGGNGGTGMDAAAAQDASAADGGADAAAPSGTMHVYVSGYGPEITRLRLDLAAGALAEQARVQGGTSPSYLAFAPDKRTLYAINEASGEESQVIAFAIDPETGALAEINRQATGGDGAPHLAVHPSGDFIAIAHYGSGHLSILQLRADGGIGELVDAQRGPDDDCRRAHQAVFDSTGEHLFVPCLQSNYVLQYTFANGTLGYNDPPTVAVNGGPRHMTFDPDEQRAYVLSELDSTITSFVYDAATGRLSSPQVIDSYEDTKGASAHIAVHPSGRFLYASNRGENSLGLFSIDAGGRPHAVAFEREMIDTPRDFTLDPTGAFLIAANQNGPQNLLVFRVAPSDGQLTRVQAVPVGGNPTFVGVVFLP